MPKNNMISVNLDWCKSGAATCHIPMITMLSHPLYSPHLDPNDLKRFWKLCTEQPWDGLLSWNLNFIAEKYTFELIFAQQFSLDIYTQQ